MSFRTRMNKTIGTLLLCLPVAMYAATPIKSMVIFGDSLSDTGNTTHLLKSLRYDEHPSYLVRPFRDFVINKMIVFADDYHVPQSVLDGGVALVTSFFDNELAPMLVLLVSQVRLVPVIPDEPYWNWHFSNGRVWNEYLAPMLKVNRDDYQHFSNQAFGGSWSQTYDHQLTTWNLIRHPIETLKSLVVGKLIPPSLGLTIQAYLLNHKNLDKKTAYFLCSGANDYINMLHFDSNYNPARMSDFVDNVIGSLQSGVKRLTDAGAKHIVIMGLPSVGLSPKFVKTYDRDILNLATKWHNERLEARVAEWQEASPEVSFTFINLQTLLDGILGDPGAHGLANVDEACIDVKLPVFSAFANSPFANNYVLQYAMVLRYRDASFAPGEKNYHVCDNPDSYLFWDEIHPGTQTHQYMAGQICKAMQEQGYDADCEVPERIS